MTVGRPQVAAGQVIRTVHILQITTSLIIIFPSVDVELKQGHKMGKQDEF